MMKFSIIVPSYNSFEYLDKCLTSIFSSTYKNFEVIFVNDGSTDNTEEKIKKYMNEYDNIIYIKQENKGLSEARNEGVKKATGDYILFVDSDDYIENELLEKIFISSKNKPDLIRFQVREVFSDKINNYNEDEFNGIIGIDAFNRIINYHYVEIACAYAYNREFFLKNDFKFKKGIYHEDFALIPLIILKSNRVNSINYIGYNYYQRNESIMHTNDYNKTLKKVSDTYTSFLYLNDESSKIKGDTRTFKSFIANSLIYKICSLKKNDYKKYKKILKDDKVYDLLLSDTLSRKIKKILVKISPKLYYKIIK